MGHRQGTYGRETMKSHGMRATQLALLLSLAVTAAGLIACHGDRSPPPARDAGILSATAGPITGMTPRPTLPPAITSPANGAVVSAGQSLVVIVHADPRSYPTGIAVIGQDPLGNTDRQLMTGSTATFNLPIPSHSPPGLYQITAVGLNAAGVLTPSDQVTVDVERADPLRTFRVDPNPILVSSIGDQIPLTVIGEFAGGEQIDISHSSRLIVRSANPTILTVDEGGVTAVASGTTRVDVTYGPMTIAIAVTVP
jgi:hypothetical protein